MSQTLLVFITIILLPTITIYIYNVVTGNRFFSSRRLGRTLLPQTLDVVFLLAQLGH